MVAAVVVQTPLGWLAAAARNGKLIAVNLPVATEEEARATLPADARFGGDCEVLSRLSSDLARYFAGESVDLSQYPVDLTGLQDFTRRALSAAQRVPYGEVRTYWWVAEHAGSPEAARAAGQAMHHNPLPLVIPCHRVVGSDGRLTGFGGGLEMKRALLALEGVRCHDGKVVAS
jgi:methylated-DNA-[protein]-cysteine S-methyltransferase